MTEYKIEKNTKKERHRDLSQWGLGISQDDHLMIGACDTIQLAKEYGTPLHVVDRHKLIENYCNFKRAFVEFYPKSDIYYSYKTNCIPGILSVLHSEGAGVSAISPYELWLAFKLEVKPNKIIFNGVNKTEQGLREAVGKNIFLINIDNMDEFAKVENISKELKKKANLGIRICCNNGSYQQFGLDIKSGLAFKAFERAAISKDLNPLCISVHLGSGISNPHEYIKAIRNTVALMKELKNRLRLNIKYLDIGGGFGVATVRTFNVIESKMYHVMKRLPKPPSPDNCPTIKIFAQIIASSIKDECKKFRLQEPILLLEPGRFITSSAQILLLEVITIKENNKAKFAIVNGGRKTIAYLTPFEYHEVLVANRISEGLKEKYHILGQHSGDWIYLNKKLPRLRAGDILSIMDAGAYFISFSNNYSFPRPPVVMVSEGKDYLIRKRESYEYMIGMDDSKCFYANMPK